MVDKNDNMNMLEEIVKKAQEVQDRMQKAQSDMSTLRVVGESGAGMVKVTMTGRHDVVEVNITEDAYDDGVTTLQELLAAAFNDAVRRVERVSRDKLTEITAGMKLPNDDWMKEDGDA